MFVCERSRTHIHTSTHACLKAEHVSVCVLASELTEVMRRWTHFYLQQSFLSLVKKLNILLADLGEEGLISVLWAQSFSKQWTLLRPLSGQGLRTQQMFTYVCTCMYEKSLCFCKCVLIYLL